MEEIQGHGAFDLDNPAMHTTHTASPPSLSRISQAKIVCRIIVVFLVLQVDIGDCYNRRRDRILEVGAAGGLPSVGISIPIGDETNQLSRLLAVFGLGDEAHYYLTKFLQDSILKDGSSDLILCSFDSSPKVVQQDNPVLALLF